MNIYLKYYPVIELMKAHYMFSAIDTPYKFGNPIEEYVNDCLIRNSDVIKAVSISIPHIDVILTDDVIANGEYLSKTIELIQQYIINLKPEVQKFETIALNNVFTVLRNDFYKSVDRIANENKEYFCKIAQIYKTNNNSDELIEGLFKVYFRDKFKNDNIVKETILDFLKRYRYREKIFNRFSRYFFWEDASTFIENYRFNFELYRGKVYRYFFEFYIRSDNPNLSTACNILHYSDITDEMNENETSELNKQLIGICRDNVSDKFTEINSNINIDFISDIEDEHDTEFNEEISINGVARALYSDFSFRLHLNKPLEHQLEELESFRDNMSIYVSSISNSLKTNSIPNLMNNIRHPLMLSQMDYIRDKSGKIVERENIGRLFQRWQRYLDVYDMRKRNLSWGQIIMQMSNKDVYNKPPKTAKDARDDFNEAGRLIESASKLTFPD